MNWDELSFWDSGEWQAVDERLTDINKSGGIFCPQKENLFAAFDAIDFNDVRCVLVGQDPYPDPSLATGLAFSIPKSAKKIPVTLANIFQEYATDTHHPAPQNGDLTKWCKNGVLLWNAIPTCDAWKSMSHAEWTEYSYLNKEIFNEQSERGIVFVLLGRVAEYSVRKYINEDESEVLAYSHPSPRGVKFSKTPFIGSRMFTTVNDKLAGLGLQPIDWKL